MKRNLFNILFVLIFLKGFSQWHQLPSPANPHLPGMSFDFPLNMCPVANGKIVFTSDHYLSPSSGSKSDSYLSYDDLSSYNFTGVSLSLQYGCCVHIGSSRSLNDSTISFVGTVPLGSFIWFTRNNFLNMSSVGYGNYPSEPFISCYSIATNNVYALVGGGYCSDTLNFVRTVSTSTVNTFHKLFKYFSNPSGTINYKVEFLNDSTGLCLVVYKNNQNKSTLIKTANYGDIWTELMIDSINKINDFSFPSDNIGYLTKLDGSIYKTLNGGLSWTQLTSPTTNSINCIKFANDTLGYIGCNSGQLWKTIDGGANWLSEVSTCTANISAIYTFSDVAYFVDATKKVFKNKPNVVGIKEYEKDQAQFTIYPNPSASEITIDLSSIKEKMNSIKIINVLGVIVEQKVINETSNLSTQTLSVKELPAGTYFVVIESKDRIMRKKISVIK